ncbi:MAG TPA: outer membrane protein transport protein [Bacteroidales bacterium]|nr:outer membrane protein transport protein [Bacteroidales bacterium]
MKKILFITGFLVIMIAGKLASQNEVDALRYSQINYGGTARSVAMGGAFGTLGGDFSSLSINPAGIGIYSSKEITITPSNYFVVVKSKYNNNPTDDLKYKFNLNNAGIVLAFTPKKESVCKGIQIGFGFNKLNNYSYNAFYEGQNTANSILDYFLASAQGIQPQDLDEFNTKLAFNTYLIDTMGGLTNYVSPILHGGTLQSKSTTVSGSNSELVLTVGGNLNDKLYIGGTIGFPFIRYTENSIYEETDAGDTLPNFKKMEFNNYLETQGSGFNFKFGVIYKITDWVRIGASIHTPTFYSMKDKWNTDIVAYYDDGTKYSSQSPNGAFDYQLNTPFRTNGGVSFVIKKIALISGEYEFVDYRNARLRSATERFKDENKAIDDLYTYQSNVRAGFEIKYNIASFRGGYTFSSSPYASKEINDGTRHSFNGGVGIRINKYFFDIAYSYSMSKEKYYLYSLVPYPVSNSFVAHNVLFTFGVKL